MPVSAASKDPTPRRLSFHEFVSEQVRLHSGVSASEQTNTEEPKFEPGERCWVA